MGVRGTLSQGAALLAVCASVLVGCSTLLDPYLDKESSYSPPPRPMTYPPHLPSERSPDSVERDVTLQALEREPQEQRVFELEEKAPPAIEAEEPSVVISLLNTADQQFRHQEYEAAAATVERALRISPRSTQAYRRLAEIRIQQGRYSAAEQMARKALLYVVRARNPQSLVLRNQLWTIIANAREGLGDHQGAADARQNIR